MTDKLIKGEKFLDELKECYNETKSLQKTADKISRLMGKGESITRATVLKIFRKHGIKTQSQEQAKKHRTIAQKKFLF